MQFKNILAAGFVSTAFARGVPPSSNIARLGDPLRAFPQDAASPIEKRAVTINVFVHVVSVNNTVKGGNVPDALIQQQTLVLNQAYSSSGISFRLLGIDRTISPAWSENGTQAAETQMKRTLRKGGVADLNLYILNELLHDQPGSSTYPWDYQSHPHLDGSSIAVNTMPGGSHPSYNKGITLVHYVGHWLGLYNTFQGGCSAPGDYVDDTPFQASPSRGCPTGRDTCPQPGADPIHNYMDTSDDDCRTHFTHGQMTRIFQSMRQFRGI